MKTAPSEPKILGGENFAEEMLRSVQHVFLQAQVEGAPAVDSVFIEDKSEGWRDLALALPVESRWRSVILYQSAEALDFSGRLAIGGALPRPPSTLRAIDASWAASRGRKLRVSDPVALSELRNRGWSVLCLQPWVLWREALGFRAVISLLTELAGALENTPVVEGSSLLLPPDVDRGEIFEAWKGLKRRPPWALEKMLKINGEPCLKEGLSIGGRLASLPEGDFPGRWRLAENGESFRWELEGLEARLGSGLVPSDGGAGEILRLPSWLHLDLGTAGSPGRELLGFWKGEAESPQPWIPNLGPDGLSAVLALGRSILVDGPTVPPG